MMRKLMLASAALAVAVPAMADPIPVINTGLGAATTVDSAWTVNSGAAYVASNVWPVGTAWLANSATSSWISPYPAVGTTAPVANFVFATSFNLAGLNPATASLTGRYAADNKVTSITLNGTTIFTAPVGGNQYNGWQALPTINSGFIAGINQLAFTVTNYAGTSGNPTGFRAELAGTAVAAVPEPSTWAMMIIGVGMAGAALRRRRAIAIA